MSRSVTVDHAIHRVTSPRCACHGMPCTTVAVDGQHQDHARPDVPARVSSWGDGQPPCSVPCTGHHGHGRCQCTRTTSSCAGTVVGSGSANGGRTRAPLPYPVPCPPPSCRYRSGQTVRVPDTSEWSRPSAPSSVGPETQRGRPHRHLQRRWITHPDLEGETRGSLCQAWLTDSGVSGHGDRLLALSAVRAVDRAGRQVAELREDDRAALRSVDVVDDATADRAARHAARRRAGEHPSRFGIAQCRDLDARIFEFGAAPRAGGHGRHSSR
ncbi:MAG: hypothetical protein JWO67_2565 [Streptosporangiaceae bacterium]|nr:hypothetical protein [Streptosporangiaceae bacterium]